MKYKSKVTTEVEIEVQVPAFFKHRGLEVYYAVYSENESDRNGAIRCANRGIELLYPSTVMGMEIEPVTEAEFNAFAEKTIDQIQGVFYQTVNQ